MMHLATLRFAVAATLASAAHAQGTYSDLPSRVHDLGADARHLASGDFDGDGRSDFALARTAGSIAIALSNAQGEPIETTSLAAAPFARDVYVADFDGDGRQDVAAYVAGSVGALRVWLGDGAGGFAPAKVSVPLAECSKIVPADVDGDGDLDFYGLATRVQIWINDGTGQMSFTGQGKSPGFAPLDLAVADWNSDGFDDFALALTSQVVRLEFANGAGGVTSFADFSTATLGAVREVIVTDGNGDGHADLIAVSEPFPNGPASVHCLPGDGLGSLGAAVTMAQTLRAMPVALAARDLDGDGAEELLAFDVVDGTTVLEPLGACKWAPGARFAPLSYATDGVLADVNGDGALDVATLMLVTPALGLTRARGAGTFDTALTLGTQFEIRGLATLDFDADGRDEIVIADKASSSLAVFHSNASGGFDGPAVFATQVGPRAPALGDVDGDGDVDALVPHDLTTSISYLAGDGQGGFAAPVFVAVGGKSLAAVLDDVDGDGDVDGVLAIDGPPGVQVVNGDGTGQFVGGAIFSTILDPAYLVGDDFDGDGDLDLAIGSNKFALAAVHLGDGAGTFGAPQPLPVADSLADLLLADLDGDGRTDIVASYVQSNRTDVFFGAGDGTFGTPVALSLGAARGLGADDVDADGDDDLYVVEAATNFVTLVLGDPSRTLVVSRRFSAGVDHAQRLAVGRFGPAHEIGFVSANEVATEPSLAVAIPTAWPGAPSLYCTAKTNSLGCVPYVGFSGAPSFSATSGFTITAQHVLNQKVGLFFYSLAGPNAVPFLGGTYCVKAPTRRTSLQSSGGNPPPADCSGTYSLDFNAYMALGSDPNLVPGTTVRGQFWSRDPGFLAPNNVGFTSAIRFTVEL